MTVPGDDFAESAIPPKTIPREGYRWNLPAVLLLAIILALPTFAFILGIHQLKGGWDDGAITAAFSRTLAKSGRFALTPLSEKVEGFSSVTWVCLLTVPYYLFHTTRSILIGMKLLSALSFLLSLIVFRRLARRLLLDNIQAALATVLLGINLCPLLDTLDGMEMNLYMLLVLCLADLSIDGQHSIRKSLWIWGLTFALVATRFESPYAVVALLAGLLLARERPAFFQVAAALLTSFGAMELWRYWEFGVWMPNTVYAKMQPPYSPPTELTALLQVRVNALAEIIVSLGAPLFALLLIAIAALLWTAFPLPQPGKKMRIPIGVISVGALLWTSAEAMRGFYYTPEFSILVPAPGLVIVLLAIALILWACLNRRSNSTAKLAAALIAAGVLFGILFGRNWGYPGRMILPFIPFMVLGVAYFIHQHIASNFWRNVALAGCIACQLLTWIPGARNAWLNGCEVPMRLFENTGKDADGVRRLIHQPTLTVLLPDMGGSSLCCENLQVFDSALLTNTYLAHNGYTAFGEYLNQLRPEVIETHGMWSVVSGIYSNYVMNNYHLAVVGRSRLLLRDDIYQRFYRRLQATTGAQMVYGEDCAKGIIDPAVRRLDDQFLAMRQPCLYISRQDLARNGISID